MADHIDIGVQSVVITIDQTDLPADVLWGPPNLYKLGKCWFMFGTYAGKVQFINQPKSIFFPEGPGATGFKYILRPPLTLTGHSIYNKLYDYSITTGSGTVNLGKGKVGGLTQLGPDGTAGTPCRVYNTGITFKRHR